MEIIVFVDKDGTIVGECDYRAFEICKEDEQNLFVMIGHSKAEYGIPEQVHVLALEEYASLNDKTKKYEEYIKWKNARDVYLHGKEMFDL